MNRQTPSWESCPNTTVTIYFLRESEIYMKFLIIDVIKLNNLQDMYLPIDKYKGIRYPCLNKSTRLSKNKKYTFKIDNILLYSPQDEEFGYSFLYIKYNETVYKRLPFEGHVLTKKKFLFINAKLDTEYVFPIIHLMINGTIDENKLFKKISQYDNNTLLNNILQDHLAPDMSFLPLFFLLVAFSLFIGMMICLVCFCKQNTKKIKKFNDAYIAIEKEYIIKILSEIYKNNHSTVSEDENNFSITKIDN